MPLLYNQTPVVPTPLVSISEQIQTAPDGTQLGSMYEITLKGTLVAVPPGTTPIPTESRLGVLLTKQKNLSTLFSENGKTLEIYSPDGTAVTKCNPIIKNIEFSEGIWVDKTEYTISLEAPSLYDNAPSTKAISEFTDEWTIEEAGFTTENGDDLKPVWQLTHNVSAKGKLVYNENGGIDEGSETWKQAKDWVLDRLETSNFDSRPFDINEELNIADGGQGYNHIRTERVDIQNGSFAITETWILAYGISASEDYTINVKLSPTEEIDATVTINGTIKGFSSGLNNLETRMANAINYWPTVKARLYDRAKAVVQNLTLNPYATNATLDYNYAEGTLTYNYDYNTKPAVSSDNVYDTYVVSKKSGMDSSEVIVQIQGTIQGRLQPGEPNSNLLKYERAKTYFDTINNDSQMLARASKSGVSGLKAAKVNSNVDLNLYEGSITYNFEFNNRLDNQAKNEYTISHKSSREDGRTFVSIEGTITGLKDNEDDPPSKKYANALSYWNSWNTQIFSLATAFAPGVTLNPQPTTKSRGDNNYQGIINYNYEYNTDSIPSITDALTENISVSEVNKADLFAVIPVIGRSKGPILQDLKSKKETSRSLSIEVVMKPNAAKPNTDSIVALYKPGGNKVFIDKDEESWVETTKRYSRSVVWIYES